MSGDRRVVYDCNVFPQALASPTGPASACVDLVLAGEVELFLSPFVPGEIRHVASRPRLVAKFRLREDRVAALLEGLSRVAVLIFEVPTRWTSARDPDDAHYVNLALAAGAELIVSRDQDLLALNDRALPESLHFQARFPDFRILTPPAFSQKPGMTQP